MATADTTGIGPARVQALARTENARFAAERPRSMALQERARRSMPRRMPVDRYVATFDDFLTEVT